MPWSIDTLVASVVRQLRVEDLPLSMVAGLAVKPLICGAPRTLTVTLAVADPTELVAVSV